MRMALLLLLLAAAPLVRADDQDKPLIHFFIVPSPSNRFHAVQTVRPWQEGAASAQLGRLQVFATETGQEVWRMERMLCAEGEVHPADDGEHLVLVRYRVAGGEGPVDLDAPVVSFYARTRLLKSYSLRELKVDRTKILHGVSYSYWVTIRPGIVSWEWEWPPDSERGQIAALTHRKPNPRWDKNIFELEIDDGQVFRFDPVTGGMLSPGGK